MRAIRLYYFMVLDTCGLGTLLALHTISTASLHQLLMFKFMVRRRRIERERERGKEGNIEEYLLMFKGLCVLKV